MTRKVTPWTKGEEELLLQMLKDGRPIIEVFKSFNRTRKAINRRIDMLDGTKYIKASGVRRVLRVWQPEEDKSLEGMLRDKKTVDEIGAELDRTHRAVVERIKHLELQHLVYRKPKAVPVLPDDHHEADPKPMMTKKPDPWAYWDRANKAVGRMSRG